MFIIGLKENNLLILIALIFVSLFFNINKSGDKSTNDVLLTVDFTVNGISVFILTSYNKNGFNIFLLIIGGFLDTNINRLFCGIDYSISSPALTFISYNNYEENIDTFFFIPLNDNHETVINITDNIRFHCLDKTLIKSELSLYQRIYNIANVFIYIIESYRPHYIGIEGYSLGSIGMKTTIIENLGYLKMKLFEIGDIFTIIAPTSIKKYFYGSGKATKEQMVNMFNNVTGINICDILMENHLINTKTKNKLKSPITDIADSYAVAKTLQHIIHENNI